MVAFLGSSTDFAFIVEEALSQDLRARGQRVLCPILSAHCAAGRGLLLLTPSEQAFLEQLQDAKVPIKSIKVNPGKTQPITPALQALLSKNQALKVMH